MLTIESIDAELRDRPAYLPQRVAYHNNGTHLEAPNYFQTLLRNVGNHVTAAPPKSEIIVVSHALGLDLLRKSANVERPNVLTAIDDLRARGVRFLACRNTLREREIDPSDLHGVVAADFVPSGVAHLTHLQSIGYGYLHI
jgi:intracellular sulfur oxidation DsrE/DsrF family protein